MESHPRINLSNPTLKHNKIILGSFPTWSLTNSRDEVTTAQKLEQRIANGDIPFFYGSSGNRFWKWYQTFIDSSISLKSIEEIEMSLRRNSIGITDMIISCDRKEKSALDKHLTNRIYNYNFFQVPAEGQKLKILCSSKGVMNEMLLNKEFMKKHPYLVVDETVSLEFQTNILRDLNGEPKLVKKPFFRLLRSETGGTIECFSIPSPGSPYRKLDAFGYNSGDLETYLNNYLQEIFNWLKK